MDMKEELVMIRVLMGNEKGRRKKGLYLEWELKEKRKGIGLGFFGVKVMGEGVMAGHG